MMSPFLACAETTLPIAGNPPAYSLVATQSNIAFQPFDIDEKGFYLLPERLLENTDEGMIPRYLLKLDAPKRQFIIEFPFAKLRKGMPSGYAVGMQGIEKVELIQQGGSLIDLARVVLTYKAGIDLKTLNLLSLSNGRLLIANPQAGASNIVRSESRHGGGIIENTQSPPYAPSPVPSNTNTNANIPSPTVTKTNDNRTVIEVIEIEDQFFMLKPSLNSSALKVKNEFYLENPHRFVLDLDAAVISPKLFSSEPDAKGAYPTSGVTQWQGWSVRVSQNTPNVVRVVIETEEPRNFTVLQGNNNAFKNSLIIQPSPVKNPFWDKVKINQPKVMSALKQLYISNESPNTPIKFRLESQRPIQYKVVKESPTRFSVDLLNVTAPPEPLGFDVSHFPYLKTLSHVQSSQGSRLLVELNKPFEDLRSTPFTSVNALELSFNLLTQASVVNTPNPSNNANRPPNNGRKVVVLDAGHGGKDAGAMRNGIMEKNLNLSVALKLRKELQARGYVVYMTRSSDTFLSLKEITQVAASYNPHIFISVHHNSSNSSAIYGLETYYYHAFSLSLAQAVHTKQVQSLAVVDRGVRKNQFYVINHTSVPSILCELGYVSNPNELKVLNTELRQRQQAKAIADGVDAYFKRNGR
ncbi:MAG: N-acetylmuramoyl-L-alanine amidase [Vampirovibrionales bacterium]|jgi:N-acetylmuramoyl-L-alanine amidase|nr:N-acetylmuramoyl-L-alanine amidase [Vampirovibrionales bacterium]